MIPADLSVPTGGTGPWPRPGTWIVRLAALVLLVTGLTGTMAWLVTLSPLQLERWHAIETSHYVTITQPGTYLLFEEGTGASTRRGDPEVIVSVRSIAGRPIPLRSLIDSQGRSPHTYDVRFHQGRAIAAVDVDRPGRYIVVSFSSSAIDPADRSRTRGPIDLSTLPGLALGPDGEPSAWGAWPGLVLIAGVPVLLGLALAGWARRSFPLPVGPVVPRTGARSR